MPLGSQNFSPVGSKVVQNNRVNGPISAALALPQIDNEPPAIAFALDAEDGQKVEFHTSDPIVLTSLAAAAAEGANRLLRDTPK